MFLCTFNKAGAYAWRLVLASCLAAFPDGAWSQGISLSGVGEASVIALPSGIASTNLAVTAAPANPAGTTNIVFVLERQGSVLLTRTSPPPYSVTFTNLATGKYYLSATLLGNGATPDGNVSFDIAAASQAPANDNWAQAAALALNAPVISTNTYATSEVNEPAHAGSVAGKSVWWSWSALSDGVFTATTAGSSFDTVLGVYSGTNVATLTQIQSSDDAAANTFSQVTFSATNGTVYYFAVDSASAAASGTARLNLTATRPPIISISAPLDGLLMLTPLSSTVTNTPAAASITDPTGIARVDYWFNGSTGASRSGTLSAPYQLSLTNLTEGYYLLTYAASNNAGLISVTNSGFSVISLAPLLFMDEFSVSSNRFQFAVTGFKGRNYSVQASKKLDVWCSVTAFTNFGGAEKVTDTNAPLFSQRFYRASSSQ